MLFQAKEAMFILKFDTQNLHNHQQGQCIEVIISLFKEGGEFDIAQVAI